MIRLGSGRLATGCRLLTLRAPVQRFLSSRTQSWEKNDYVINDLFDKTQVAAVTPLVVEWLSKLESKDHSAAHTLFDHLAALGVKPLGLPYALEGDAEGVDVDLVHELLRERDTLRSQREFDAADVLAKELHAEHGVAVHDKWRRWKVSTSVDW